MTFSQLKRGLAAFFRAFFAGSAGASAQASSGERLTLDQVVDKLLEIYSHNPKGICPGTSAEAQVKTIGQALYEAGGMDLMLMAHDRFATRNFSMKRDLERVWDGVGRWQG